MKIVDGKKIADGLAKNLKKEVSKLKETPTLSVVSLYESGAGESFINIKKSFGEKIGVKVNLHKFNPDMDKEVLRLSIIKIAKESDGVVVQLPLPDHINRRQILNSVPQEKDPDVLNSFSRESFDKCKNSVIPPVAGAVKEIIERENLNLRGKKVIVVGNGFLVGAPVASWLRCQGILPKVLEEGDNLGPHLEEADAVISGVGHPKLITPDMIKEGVVLIDAGTSGQKGEIVGDVDEKCEKKASLFTPVPGGVGPITVAKLYENLLILIKNKNE